MLGIIKPKDELWSIQCSKICQALQYCEINFVAFSEDEISPFDAIKKFNITKMFSQESEMSDSIRRATDKYDVKLEIRKLELCSNLLITLDANIEDIYKCDECCVHSYTFENPKVLGKRLDNSYNKFFRLYSSFLHAYTCYCGMLRPNKLATAVKSADSVVCLSDTSYYDFKLINKNVTMASGEMIPPSPVVKTNFDIAFELSENSVCLNRKLDFEYIN